jgi:hypothetical protein
MIYIYILTINYSKNNKLFKDWLRLSYQPYKIVVR